MNHLTIFTTLFFLTLINALPIPNYADRLVWASTPDTRGTLTIIFSCASALILCIWSGIHSNINPSEDDEEKQGAMSLIAKTVGKAALASIALLAPDITISGLTAKTWASQRGKKAGHVGLKMSFFATMGGFCFSETTLNGYHRKSLDFDALLHPNIMDIIQTHPLPEIEDKSKASGIAKTVAVIQVGWVLLQCLGRYLERLHITLLELNTCVHVVLAIVTYGIWMRKPLDVGVSIPAENANNDILNTQKSPQPEVSGSLDSKNGTQVEVAAPIKPGEHNNDNQNNQHFNKSWCQQHRIALLAISTIMGIFYGSIHITKWNSAWFPTHVEHLLWNISCCIGSVAVLPIGLSMLIPFKQERPILRGVLITLCIVSWVLFGAARVYFIVESFMSMRSLPGSAYRSVQWSNALPHF
ncbi:hypothetical protein BZA77DRAFT_273764 [Pyronema omphalodes]|nr:hypothetical protein BZA77DRAFT_273764 [Pyronema omphalodes]